MESFAHVLRALLTRIRAIDASRHTAPRPEATYVDSAGRYRVPPTRWGLEAPTPGSTPTQTAPDCQEGKRRGLELTLYGLPVPKGLPAT